MGVGWELHGNPVFLQGSLPVFEEGEELVVVYDSDGGDGADLGGDEGCGDADT